MTETKAMVPGSAPDRRTSVQRGSRAWQPFRSSGVKENIPSTAGESTREGRPVTGVGQRPGSLVGHGALVPALTDGSPMLFPLDARTVASGEVLECHPAPVSSRSKSLNSRWVR